MGTLIFPYNRVINHDMSIESYNYIRKLPAHLTTGFKIEAALWFAEININYGFDVNRVYCLNIGTPVESHSFYFNAPYA